MPFETMNAGENPEVKDDFLTGFDDDDSWDGEEVQAEEEQTAEEGTEETVEETPSEPVPEVPETIAYTYNSRRTDLPYNAVNDIAGKLGMTPEAVVTILQKGSNYDSMLQRTQPYENLMGQIRRYATNNNLDTNAAVEKVLNALNVAQSTKYLEELRKQYPAAPPQLLQEFAMAKAKEGARVEMEAETANQERIAEENRQRMWVAFFRNHAGEGVTGDNLSPRMLEALRDGEDPEVVYQQEANAQLRKQIEQLTKKASNGQRSTGSAKGTSGPTKSDPFLDAYL